MGNAVSLASNYLDYYDHYFSREGDLLFERYHAKVKNRIETFDYLNSEYGFPVPLHGKVVDLDTHFRESGNSMADLKLVVYTSIVDKGCLVSIEDAMLNYKENFASIYIPHSFEDSLVTARAYSICGNVFWVNYINDTKEEWRSNYGDDFGVYFVGIDSFWKKHSPFLVYSIDFIPTEKGMVAFDFDIYPRIWGSGIENEITSSEMFAMISDSMCGVYGKEGNDVGNYIKL